MTDLTVMNLPSERLDLDRALLITQNDIKLLLTQAPAGIRHQTAHLSRAVGKNIRAQSLLVCAAQEDGLVDPDAVKAAAAVELLHLATLVHDDIIDSAPKRRGIATLNAKYGDRMAVICGDYLLSLSMQLASTMKEPEKRPEGIEKMLPRYISEICLGELWQDRNAHNYKLSEREYFHIISGKTGALFEASFYAGFTLSGEAAKAKDAYTEIGRNTGIIFQLADDCLDYEETQKTLRKPVLSDFRQGVVTLPLIHALKKDSTLRAAIEAGISPVQLKRAVARSGGLDYAHAKINELYASSHSRIFSLDASAEKKERLAGLLKRAAGLS